MTNIFLLSNENNFTLPFDDKSMEPCFLTKMQNSIYSAISFKYYNIFKKIPNNTRGECTVKTKSPEVQVKQFLKENILCNGIIGNFFEKGRLSHKISYNQSKQKIKETRKKAIFARKSEGTNLKQK